MLSGIRPLSAVTAASILSCSVTLMSLQITLSPERLTTILTIEGCTC